MSKESSIKEYISKAKKIINDDKKLKELIDDVLKKLKEVSSDKKTSAKLNDSLRLFIRIINAYTSKEYTYVPWKTICLIVAGLIYFIYPVDLIPTLYLFQVLLMTSHLLPGYMNQYRMILRISLSGRKLQSLSTS